jgi:putative nucleotidyltransferase with HDIG domain
VLLEQIAGQLGVDAAMVLLLDAGSQTLNYGASFGFRTEALKHTRLRLGDGNAGRAALQQQTIAIPDLASQPGSFTYAPAFGREGFQAYYATPLIANGQVTGVLEVFHRARLEPDAEWLSFLDALAGQAAIAIDNSTLFEDLQQSNQELAAAYEATIEGWSRALDLRDHETEGHTQRVTDMALRLAAAMGLSVAELEHIRRGALLHDIGKMGVPDRILLKPGPLTDEEWVSMRQHPTLAYEMLAPIHYLRQALDIPYCHHEKWDGSGYPRQLQGETIPLPARIFAVVDVWDALSSDRPYRPAWPQAQVLAHIRGLSGSHFDPQVVKAFLKLLSPAP